LRPLDCDAVFTINTPVTLVTGEVTQLIIIDDHVLGFGTDGNWTKNTQNKYKTTLKRWL
jgi:hypothetical protein